MTALLASACALLGLVVGSVLHAVIARAPDRAAALAPHRPRPCRSCGSERHGPGRLALLDAVRRRRCTGCGGAPSAREAVVEVVTAALFAVTAVRVGAQAELVPFLVLVAALVALSVIDLDTLRLPDRVVFPTLGVSAALLAAAAVANGEPGRMVSALLGALLFAGILLVLHLVSPAGMGFGDVKLGLLLGLFLAWVDLELVLVGLFVGAALGTVMGLGVVVATRDRRRAFPFGPALAAGTVVTLLVAA